MDTKSIRNMNETVWFQGIDQYPSTIGQMKLLVYIVDTMGIFDDFDISKTEKMDSKRLDLIYAILRITNNEFDIVTNQIVKKIFISRFKNFFKIPDQFIDQLSQDINHFVCTILKKYYSKLKHPYILSKFVKYLKKTFENRFYKKLIPSCMTNSEEFYSKNHYVFNQMIKDFISFSKRKLNNTHRTMHLFLSKIFDKEISPMVIAEINFSIQKNFDIKNLFDEDCMEINIYCEQKIDDELELITTESPEKQISIESIGYKTYSTEQSSILQPFLDHQFVSSKKDLIKILIYVLTKFRSKWISSCDFLLVPYQYSRILSMDDICQLLEESMELGAINEKNINFVPPGLILKIMSWIFNIRIELYTKDLNLIEIEHSESKDTLVVHQDTTNYYSLYPINKKFIPINKSGCYSKSVQKLLDAYDKKHEIFVPKILGTHDEAKIIKNHPSKFLPINF